MEHGSLPAPWRRDGRASGDRLISSLVGRRGDGVCPGGNRRFNSLREPGGSRRIVEDEVKRRLVDHDSRRRRVDDATSLFVDRPRLTEPCELTSRVSTNDVAYTKRRLALSHDDKEHVDVALANMISVGLDIQRLGLMVVLGQPKTASEYIQATSRVGRDDQRPGLVVTLLNVYRPRDRSHYERFCAWHESFYRSGEATSATPSSPRAIDRGIAAVTVALARLGHPEMTPPRGALAVKQPRVQLDYVAEVLSRRAEGHDAQLGREEAIATRKGDLQYQQEVGVAPPLLFAPLDPELAKQTKEAQQFKERIYEPRLEGWLSTAPHNLPCSRTSVIRGRKSGQFRSNLIKRFARPLERMTDRVPLGNEVVDRPVEGVEVREVRRAQALPYWRRGVTNLPRAAQAGDVAP